MTTRIIGRRVRRFGTIGSTMEEAARLGDAGEPEGTIVTAAEQTAGRGRAGRVWLAPPRTALLCSVLLRPNVPLARLPVLSLVLGVATAEAIEATTGLPCRLKWPNDLWLGESGRKVCGVLLTSRVNGLGIDYAVAGIGINVNLTREELPAGATSLFSECGAPTDVEALLTELMDRLDARYGEYVATAGRPNLDPWRQRAAMLGESVTLEDGGVQRSGIFTGIDDDGALLLQDASGHDRRIFAGELARGPRSLRLG